MKKVTPQKAEKTTFAPPQIQALLQDAGVQMKAMIWLGLNCGFGHADVKMASTYVQNISEQTDRVINNSPKVMVEGSP